MKDDKYSKLQKTTDRQRNEIARLTMQCEELAAVKRNMAKELKAMKEVMRSTLDHLPDDLRRAVEREIMYSDNNARAVQNRRAA